MSPSAYVHLLSGVHFNPPVVSDHELAEIVSRTWTCAECGHREHDTDPARLRGKAQAHAKGHTDAVL